ncbi:MAG: carboxynorspermidine decarboxylase [Verrucomicrobiota bacterium]
MDLSQIPSPSYVIDLGKLRENLSRLSEIKERAGCHIVLALKSFAMWSLFPLLRKSLDGVCASGPWEARLGHEHFGGGHLLTYSPAYSEQDVDELLPLTTHLDFNSLSQWARFRERVAAAPRSIQVGLRINPEHSTQDRALYDPCLPGSRLGVLAAQLEGQDLAGITGFHFHTLCQQNADALESTLAAVEERFGRWLPQLEWVNFGGGHHLTRSDYDVERLVRLIGRFRERYRVEVFLEPGEAVVLDAGVLVSEVLDLTENAGAIALLNVSATAHMPDVLEMPYRPTIQGAGEPEQFAYRYQLASPTCLAGDVIGTYSFPQPLSVGDRIVFQDMAHYTMVKTTTFNGVKHPSLGTWEPENQQFRLVKEFRYQDFRDRLS